MTNKSIIFAAGTIALSAVVAAVSILQDKVFNEETILLLENVAVLTEDEGSKNDGALWSNPEGTRYCCGPGNVRDCDSTPIPDC